MLFFIFSKVLYVSFIGTIAALVILGIRMVGKNRLGIKFQYAIDLILIIRLLMYFGVATDISIYNYTPTYSTTMMKIPAIIESINSGANNTGDVINEQIILNNEIATKVFNTFTFIWLLGISVLVIVMIYAAIKFNKRVRKSNSVYDEKIINLFEMCRVKAGINKNVKLIKSSFVKSPCIYGLIRPKILMSESILESREKINLEYIFLHELLHIKKNHILVNYIIFTLSTIHWFNPIIRYSLNKIKEDMEIICDSEVLNILDYNKKLQYGNLLLDLQEISTRAPWLPQMAGIINNKNKLKRRIEMIKKFKKSTYNKLSIIALTGVILIGGAVLTEAKTANANAYKAQVIEDKLDYDFVNDEEVIGKWEAVDFIKNEDDFNPSVKSWKGDLYLKDLIFLKDGQMAQPIAENVISDETTPVDWLTWTKGIVMHYGDKTASSYKIKEINGEKYMIYQWKSGDYTLRGQTPWYYLLKQVK